MRTTTRTGLSTCVTERTLADQEHGVRPWVQSGHAEHTAGRVTRPLCHHGIPYRGVNILLLWGEAMAKGYTAPLWRTFKQVTALGAYVWQGAYGSLMVSADTFTKTATNDQGEDVE
jgi:antirestriction protein ArdC